MAPDVPAELMEEALARGLPVRLRVLGASMRPFVRPGDVLILAPDVAQVGVGDLVVLPAGPLVVHRVVARRGEQVWVKGDALARGDGWFARADLRARVVGIERGGRLVPLPRWRAVAFSLATAPARRVKHWISEVFSGGAP